MSDDAQALLAALSDDGTGKGNVTLRNELGWDEQRYFEARDELLDLGLAERWKGRGGSLRRSIAEPPREPDQVGRQVALEYFRERQLYDPMARSIADGWAPENRLTPCVVAITAQQGRRATGGKWSRPDIVLVAVRRFR